MEAARDAAPADLPTVVALVDEFVNEQRDLRGGPVWAALEAPRLHPDAIAVALDEAQSPGARNIVVLGTIDDAVVGLVMATIETVSADDVIAFIRVLHVQRPARKVGVGSVLLDTVIDAARRAGCTGVDATVLPGSRDAKNFFEMHGLVARAISVHRTVGEGS